MSFIKNKLSGATKRLKLALKLDDRNFLSSCKGVIHIGANTGAERKTYARYGLNVAWFEPNPEVFQILKANISDLPKQKAFEQVLAGETGKKITFNISNNGGSASSMLDLGAHQEIWPDIHFTHSVELTTTTLTDFLASGAINPTDFDVLVIDTQGTELEVLRGAIAVLPQFRFIETEAANFESYKGCCTDKELIDMLIAQGFKVIKRELFPDCLPSSPHQYFNLVFERTN